MSRDPLPMWQRYRHFLRRRTADDVRDELQFHVAMRVEEARRAGLPEEEARAAALERFGPYTHVEAQVMDIDRARDQRHRRAEWFVDMRQDVVVAVRSLRRAPAFTAAAVATLAIAIGANTAIFTVVNALLLESLPYAAPQRLVKVWGNSTAELLLLRERLRSVAGVASYRAQSSDFDDGTSAERLDGAI